MYWGSYDWGTAPWVTFDWGTFDWFRASAILLSGVITGLVVAVTYFLGRKQSDVNWRREVKEREKERKRKTPKVKVVYRHEPPMARLSGRTDKGGNPLGDFFDFHIRIENRSKYQHAERVEAVLEGMWVEDGSGDLVLIDDFFPVRLRYDSERTKFIEINPQRHELWNLGYLPNPIEQQNRLSRSHYVDVAGPPSTDDRFYLDVADFPFHQPNRFVPGRYGILVSVYAENAEKVDQHFEITWTGTWEPEIQDVVNEIIIEPKDKIE